MYHFPQDFSKPSLKFIYAQKHKKCTVVNTESEKSNARILFSKSNFQLAKTKVQHFYGNAEL